MKILVVGSGGREHALCLAFSKSKRAEKIFAASGNAGIAEVAECVDIAPDNISELANFARSSAIDLTFVGGEVPLARGIADAFREAGLNIIGPGKAAAELESSKAFAKDFMARHGVPTAKYVVAHSPDFALLELESGDFGGDATPVVVKADGLAAGKGVVVAGNRREAVTAINEMAGRVGSAASSKIVLEECLTGREISLLAFVSGDQFALMPPSRDHKRIGDGDTGPNTGGMGAVTDNSLLSPDHLQAIVDTVVRPTLRGCVKEGVAFNGILFVGLMLTADGPKVLEYNLRFGDPETQAILVRLETDLVDVCEAMLTGRLNGMEIKWTAGSSACIVLAAEGYPDKPRTGDVIQGLDEVENATVFHAGTAKDQSGNIVTAGGRVLGVTATGIDLSSALDAAYAAAGKIHWPGMEYRKDIGRQPA